MALKKKTTRKTVKSKLPLLEIKQREGSKGVMVGANTQVLIDGKPVKGATAVTFEVNARGVAKATVTLVGRFKVSGKVLTKKINTYR